MSSQKSTNFKDLQLFDVIVGNPPYVLMQPSNTDEKTLNYFKENYEVASYKIDLFHLFIEKGIKLLSDGGYLGFITPNTYLTNKYNRKTSSVYFG
jgi:tRNA1(Val) A37 N6-methylase TrmN6